MFYKKVVHKSFVKLTGKQQCQSPFFNKVSSVASLPVNYVKFLRLPFYRTHLDDCLWYCLKYSRSLNNLSWHALLSEFMSQWLKQRSCRVLLSIYSLQNYLWDLYIWYLISAKPCDGEWPFYKGGLSQVFHSDKSSQRMCSLKERCS